MTLQGHPDSMGAPHSTCSRIVRLAAVMAGLLLLLAAALLAPARTGAEDAVPELSQAPGKTAGAEAEDAMPSPSQVPGETAGAEAEDAMPSPSQAPGKTAGAETEDTIPSPSQAPGKTVRVGWHEAPYYITDEQGRRSGYSYEYQQKVASYTGWNYEYTEGSWSDLLEMLKNGEIDLMANISYTEERARDILYASVPMGTESYYLFISPDNTEVTAEDYASLDGKKIGVAKGSIQGKLFLEWEKSHNVEAELIELSTTEEESLLLLGNELDAFVTMDINADPKTTVPVWKIGSSDFYFAVSKGRRDLLPELNYAMSRIQDENGLYNQELNDRYLSNANATLYLDVEELGWLASHGKIRVGYQDNYMAFCDKDEDTGGLTGTLKDYLDYASTVLENAHLEFEAVPYPTAADAIKALKRGEVDCMFPANMTAYDSERLGIVMTPALMKTEMDAVVRESRMKEFIRKEQVTVAVNEGNTNYEVFLSENFPGWESRYYPDTPACLDAVAAGEADALIISNYRFSNMEKQCDELHLTTIYTGVEMEYYLALRKGDTLLYSILSRVTSGVPDSVVHAALTYYSTEDAKTSFGDLLKDHLALVMSSVSVILLVILILLLIGIRAQREAAREQHMVEDLNKQVFVDALTHVRNKRGFHNYVEELQQRLDRKELQEFALGVFDCDNLKIVNDQHGHDKGDIYLMTAARLICRTFQHSPVFRIGGDEFSVALTGEDFRHREELLRQFEAERQETCASAANRWEEIHISKGIAVYDPGLDGSVDDTLRRADKTMYEDKRQHKKKAAALAAANGGAE